MPRLRTVKTSSGSKAVQVVEYVNRKTVILSHIGSAKSDEELLELKKRDKIGFLEIINNYRFLAY